MEHDDDNDGCDCIGCKLSKQMKNAVEQVNAQGAANCRREVWLMAFKARIERNDHPEVAAGIARACVMEFDKAFPEVKTAAMTEDR